MVNTPHRIKSQKWQVKASGEDAVLLRSKVRNEWNEIFLDAFESVCEELQLPEDSIVRIPSLVLNLKFPLSENVEQEVREQLMIQIKSATAAITGNLRVQSDNPEPGSDQKVNNRVEIIDPFRLLIQYFQTGMLNWIYNNDTTKGKVEFITLSIQKYAAELNDYIHKNKLPPEFFLRVINITTTRGATSKEIEFIDSLFFYPEVNYNHNIKVIHEYLFRKWQGNISSPDLTILYAHWISFISQKSYKKDTGFITAQFVRFLQKYLAWDDTHLKIAIEKFIPADMLVLIPGWKDKGPGFLKADPGKPGSLNGHKRLDDTIPGAGIETDASNKSSTDEANSIESLYIKNGGIIVLHPFFPALFEACGVIENSTGEISEFKKPLAVALLNYLVTGEDVILEFELPLIKLLCGIEIDSPVFVMNGELTRLQIEECDAMLASAITHWTALKNTGLDAVRSTFLKRDALLKRQEDSWYLKIDRQGWDVLIDQLPWAISIIKHPWMKHLITCEW
jgi:hypothetical protein